MATNYELIRQLRKGGPVYVTKNGIDRKIIDYWHVKYSGWLYTLQMLDCAHETRCRAEDITLIKN